MEVLFPVSLYFRSALNFILDGYLCGTCIVGFYLIGFIGCAFMEDLISQLLSLLKVSY